MCHYSLRVKIVGVNVGKCNLSLGDLTGLLIVSGFPANTNKLKVIMSLSELIMYLY